MRLTELFRYFPRGQARDEGLGLLLHREEEGQRRLDRLHRRARAIHRQGLPGSAPEVFLARLLHFAKVVHAEEFLHATGRDEHRIELEPRTEQAPRDAHLPLHGLRAVHEGDEGPGADGTSDGSTF